MPSVDPESRELEYLSISKRDIDSCAFEAWYDRFKHVTFKSKIVELDQDFVDYLNAEGIYLPEDGQPRAAATIEEIDSDGETDFPSNEAENDDKIPYFPVVETAIKEAVYEYGAVFPKLTWSCPRDAAWISATQSVKCTSPFDVFLLLKSSDFINHDVNHAYEDCYDNNDTVKQPHHLALRKWYDLQPSMEFRCFVKNQEIIGITQRDMNYYEFLGPMAEEIEHLIYRFFEEHVQENFDNNNYVFDVYVEQERERVHLVDFNPFCPTTDSLLYDWHELMNFDLDKTAAEFRYIKSQADADGCVCNAPKFATNMIPQDVIELSSGKSIAEFAEEFQRAMANNQDDDSDSD